MWMMLRPDNTFVEARHWATPEEQHTPAVRACAVCVCVSSCLTRRPARPQGMAVVAILVVVIMKLTSRYCRPSSLCFQPPPQKNAQLCSFVQLTKQLQFQLGVSLFPPRLIRLLGLSYTCYRREQVRDGMVEREREIDFVAFFLIFSLA